MAEMKLRFMKLFLRFLPIVSRLILSGVFFVSGVLKLVDLFAAQQAVAGYALLPEWALWPATLLLPWAEIVAAVGLWVPWVRSAARVLLAMLLLVFLVAIVSAWVRGLDITCGCFGGTDTANYPWLVTRDLGLFIVLGVESLFSARGQREKNRTPD